MYRRNEDLTTKRKVALFLGSVLLGALKIIVAVILSVILWKGSYELYDHIFGSKELPYSVCRSIHRF